MIDANLPGITVQPMDLLGSGEGGGESGHKNTIFFEDVRVPAFCLIGGENNAIEQLAVLRRETDGDIGIGGATLATQLLRAHLLDELLLFTHPVVLGAGRPLFDALDQPLELDLLEQRSFDQGVTMHRYAVRGAR